MSVIELVRASIDVATPNCRTEVTQQAETTPPVGIAERVSCWAWDTPPRFGRSMRRRCAPGSLNTVSSVGSG
jgi:hypothetical protein